MATIRPEAVKLVKVDPSHEAKLAAMRERIQKLDIAAAEVRKKQAAAASMHASKAREMAVHAMHNTLQVEDDKHRPSDQTHFLRAYGVLC